jgi:PPOX class probable F420-dependent enzyme
MKFDDKVQSFLKGKHFAKLATLMKDGRPQLTPIWYVYEDGKLLVNTSRDRVKYRNIRRDPRVCLLVDEGYSYVSIWGRARVATERDPKKDIEALAIRYHGEEQGRKDARERYWKQERVSLEIVPEKVVKGL